MYRPWIIGKFGVELEFSTTGRDRSSITDEMIREALNGAVGRSAVNADRAVWRKSDGRYWDIKTDSSAGWEVASPALMLNEAGRNIQVSNACHALNSIGCVVSVRCGTHQHHETPGYDWQDLQKLLALWARYEPFFFELQPPSRRDSSYCLPIHRNRWGAGSTGTRLISVLAARRADQFDRHARQLGRSAINIGGWWANGRIEIRLHSGTLNAVKIMNWAMLIKAMIQRVKNTQMPEIELSVGPNRAEGYSTEYICKQLGLLPSRYVPEVPPESLALVSWLKARRQQFNPQTELPLTEQTVFAPSSGVSQVAQYAEQARREAEYALNTTFIHMGAGSNSAHRRCCARIGTREVFDREESTYQCTEYGFPIMREDATTLTLLCHAHREDDAMRREFRNVPQHVARAMRQRAPAEHPVPLNWRCAARIGAQRGPDYTSNLRNCFVDVNAGAVECPNRRMNMNRLCEHHHAEWNAHQPFSVVPWPSSRNPAAVPNDDDLGEAP